MTSADEIKKKETLGIHHGIDVNIGFRPQNENVKPTSAIRLRTGAL